MLQGASFSNFGVLSQKNIQKKQGNPPQELLDKLKQSGIPDEVVTQGREAVMKYAEENKIELPKPPAPPKGAKSKGAEHANKNSMLNRATDDAVKTLMEENNIPYTGKLKEDLAAIKATIASLDKDQGEVLKEKFKLAGVAPEDVDKQEYQKESFKDLNQLAALNKQMFIKKKSV